METLQTFPHPFVEILPGKYARRSRVIGYQASGKTAGVLVQVNRRETRIFGHDFVSPEAARDWVVHLDLELTEE